MNPSTARHRFFTFFHGAFFFLLLLLPSAMAQSNNNNNPQSPYVNPNFKPSMAVTIVVLCAAFVFIALFSLYIRRCSREPYMNRSIRGVNARSRRAPRGLDTTVIETFPTFVYSVVKGLKIGKGTLECAVCLNEFEDDERLRLLPKCDHVFHPECIDAWLSSHTTCPVCRADLKVDSLTDTDAPVEGSVAVDGTATPEISESQEQVLINVNDGDSLAEVINPSEITSQNRPVRSKSTKTRMGGRFPRSHSTGHSFVQPGSADNFDRFTLRLPVEVRKQIIMNGKLNRSASCVTFVNRQGSVSGSRREGSVKGGLFGRFDRSGKADSWGFSMTAPFFWRNPSVRASRKGDSSLKPPAFQVGTKAGVLEQQSSSARPPV